MGKKTAGKLNPPPSQAEFDQLPLTGLCRKGHGNFYRLHGTNPTTGDPWSPIHFSKRANSRFDPAKGAGSLCLAVTFSGALMELFDDHWGPVGSIGRSVTNQQLHDTWASRVNLPPVVLFDATGANLSKIGTDGQLLTGKYTTSRRWVGRIMRHPAGIDGILYRSRHDAARLNVALFGRSSFLPAVHDLTLLADPSLVWKRKTAHGGGLIYGPAMRLDAHPRLTPSLIELQVARIP